MSTRQSDQPQRPFASVAQEWLKKDRWSLDEAVMLWFKEDPDTLKAGGVAQTFRHDHPVSRHLDRAVVAILSWLQDAGHIETLERMERDSVLPKYYPATVIELSGEPPLSDSLRAEARIISHRKQHSIKGTTHESPIYEYRVIPEEFLRWSLQLGYSYPSRPMMPEVFLRYFNGAVEVDLADGQPAQTGAQSLVGQGERKETVAQVLDETCSGWRELTQAELDALKTDKGIGLLIIDQHVICAPRKQKGKVTLTTSEYTMLVFFIENRGAFRIPNEVHGGATDNACNMLKRLRRKVDPSKRCFQSKHPSPGHPAQWSFSPPVGRRFALIRTNYHPNIGSKHLVRG